MAAPAAAPAAEAAVVNETTPLVSREQQLKESQAEVRKGFVRKVYGILSAQLLVTVIIAVPVMFFAKSHAKSAEGALIASSGGMLLLSLVMAGCTDLLERYPYNYLMLFGMTCGMSVVVGFASSVCTWQSVALTLVVTAGVFCGLSFYAWTTSTDLSDYMAYVASFMFALMLFSVSVGIIAAISGYQNVRWLIMIYDFLCAVPFIFFMVHRTQTITGKFKETECIDNYAEVALRLYMDVAHLFLRILRLVGKRK
mmetsp:Transcript_52553/g.151506  ORF Transcript_52553/g.151506 Transcript_52553/m.151506 type:complete len:254 (+) Transcript_52553:66-827(+)